MQSNNRKKIVRESENDVRRKDFIQMSFPLEEYLCEKCSVLNVNDSNANKRFNYA